MYLLSLLFAGKFGFCFSFDFEAYEGEGSRERVLPDGIF